MYILILIQRLDEENSGHHNFSFIILSKENQRVPKAFTIKPF